MPSPESQTLVRAPGRIVVIGTGGTIAGAAARSDETVRYTAGALDAAQLVAGVPALARWELEVQSLVQMDSCDMDHATWVALGRAVREALARPDVAGVVVTHGTDTLEETATFLHHTVRATKPVVLTAAMRPATALSADGPQNLLDAVTLAGTPGVQGVLLAFGGAVLAGAEARKVHGWRVDAFDSGDGGVLARLVDGQLQPYRPWPDATAAHAAALDTDPAGWPVVEIVTSHAGARAATLEALVAAGARGLVIAGTGNGSVHAALRQAAEDALARVPGLVVRRATRCVLGGVVGAPEDRLPSAGALTPAQARVKLLLELVAG